MATATTAEIPPNLKILTALRARAAQLSAGFDAAQRAAVDQAQLLHSLLPRLQDWQPAHLTALIPTIIVRYVVDIPLEGISFWDGRWNIHIRAGESKDVQVFATLLELKHIIDHPLRRQPNRLSNTEWAVLENRFVLEVLALDK